MNRERWNSSFGMIMASLGSAVGLGALWQFPYILYRRGGGLFFLCYVFFTIAIGIPLLIAEFRLGQLSVQRKEGKGGIVGIFSHYPRWSWIGYLIAFSCLATLSYYCVVAGWGLRYVFSSLFSSHCCTGGETLSFYQLAHSALHTLLWMSLFLLLTGGICYRGVSSIEYWSKILMPFLLCILVALLVEAYWIADLKRGVSFLLDASWKQFDAKSILSALGLSFFTLSLGLGSMLTYGSYMSPTSSLVRVSMSVVFSSIFVAGLFATMLFSYLYAYQHPISEGEGLVFCIMPVVLGALPGGKLLSFFFFLLFTFTALSTSISLLEVVIGHVFHQYGLNRATSVLVSMFCVWVASFVVILFRCNIPLLNHWIPRHSEYFSMLIGCVSDFFIPITMIGISVLFGWYTDELECPWKRVWMRWAIPGITFVLLTSSRMS